MDSDILTADDLALGDEMFVEYGKKNNLSNEQNAFIDLWSAKDRIDVSIHAPVWGATRQL